MPEPTLAILAGGAGSRMGAPKSSLTVKGVPILEYLLARFDWRGPTLLVTAPGFQHPAGADLFDREVHDPVAGLGPMRGILTALEASPSDIVVVVTVDMPKIDGTHLRWIAQRLIDRCDLSGLMVRRRETLEPFPSAYRKTAIETISNCLDQGKRSVRQIATLPHFAAVDAPMNWPENIWMNLNTPGDYEQFIRELP